MSGGGQSTSTTQTSSPPEWALPLLQRGAGDALKLYNSGQGYNVYQGPTQAQMSGQTLGGMNSLLAATGYEGAPVQNQTPQQMFPDVMKLLAAQTGVNRPPQKAKPGARAKRPGASDYTNYHDS
jgi:hypothetical protein